MVNIFLFCLGLAIGSFLNVLIDRLPNEEEIIGRSHCDHCRRQLEWRDLFPVFSYLFLKGRCRFCQKKLSLFYPLVELITGLTFVFVYRYSSQLGVENLLTAVPLNFEQSLILIHLKFLQLLALLGIFSCLIVIFFADWKYRVIPDSIQLVFFAFSLLFLFSRGAGADGFLHHVVGALATALPILFLFLATGGRAMGFGDVKLAFNMGFLLGLWGGSTAVYFGFIFGGIAGVILVLLGKKKLKSKIAFGPFLILGLLAVFLCQKQIIGLIKIFFGI